MSLPIFTAAPRPTIEWDGEVRIDLANEPRCPCSAPGPLDADAGVCVACWRVCVLAPAFSALFANGRRF